MFRYAILLALIAITWTSSVYAQKSVSERTQDLIAQLDKTKSKKKNKGGVERELFVEVKFVPTPEGDIRDFSGKYLSSQDPRDGLTRGLEMEVAADGSVSGKGYDLMSIEGGREYFTLKDARVSDSLLTATRVFRDRSEPFDAVFVIATRRDGTTRKDAKVTKTAVGIAYMHNMPEGGTVRAFLEKMK